MPNQLASAVRAGDGIPVGLSEPAFRDLYQRLLGPVYQYVRYRLGPADAGDVAAEVFARAWAHRGQFDPSRGSAEAWLWAMARNGVVDALRRRGARPVAAWLDPARAGGGQAELDGALTWDEVLGAMSRLAEVDQDIIALRFGAGLTNREIAGRLGLAEANVAQRLRRALRTLRRAIDEEQDR